MGAFGEYEALAGDDLGKFADFDTSNLESLSANEQAPSPDGAASQGALGAPATVGGTSIDGPAALGGEGPMDMLSIFNQSTEEDRDYLTEQVMESYAPLGYSLEGAMDNALMKGGPQSLARAAEFGIDLMPFADKINPDGSYSKTPGGEQQGAMGPPEPTELMGPPEEGALSQEAEKKEQIKIKKKEQRQKIGAFLIEAGLRTLASARDDTAGAMAEGALGTMTAQRERKRQSEQDSIAKKQRERNIRREDESDEAGKLEAQRAEQDRQYEISQREAEEAKTARAGMQSVTNKAGETYYFDPLDPEAGKWVETADGKKVLSDKVGLSRESIETSRRAYESRINSKVEKIKAMSEFDRVDFYPTTDGLTGEALRDEIIKQAKIEAAKQAEEEEEPDNYLDWE